MQEHPASDFSLAELTRLWNRGYAGYFVPVHFSEAQLAAHFRCGGIDLSRSLVWTEDGDPRAFSYLGVRGQRGWIGGFAIAPEARGRGLSYRLFARHVDAARAAGTERLQLEVFVGNWAERVYERAGFSVTRRVAVLHGTLPEGGAGEGAFDADPAALLEHYSRLHAASEPAWNREAEWVRGAVALGGVDAVGVGDEGRPSAAAWVRVDSGGVRVIDAAAVDDGSAQALAACLVSRYGGRTAALVNEPEDTPVSRAFAAVGLEPARHQFEMHRAG